jgi:tol-pal system protein YbgF
MMPFSRGFQCLGVAMSLGIALPVFAESAPVFDADTLQQQFEHAGEPVVADTAPPPPASTSPAPSQDSTFMPVPADAPATTAPAPQAQSFPPQPAASSGNLTPDQRVHRLEQQMNALQSSDINAKTDSLQSQVQALRSQVEQLTHQLTEMQAQQKAMYSDLDKRLSTAPAASSSDDASLQATTPAPLKSSAKSGKPNAALAKPTATKAGVGALPATTPTPPPSNSKALDAAEEQKIYQSAYDLIKAKKYSQAATTLQGMLQKYPSGQFASNAHYWLGELYGLMGKNDQALNEFSAVVKSFPSSPRVSDAQLKVGLIYASQNQWSDAKMALTKVTTKYPGTASARLAVEQLAQIKQAGH